MRSSKSRSRKNRNNRPSGGNIINRVFDSQGPDGKVRGTPQQIIDKYNQLHRDAVLNGDRVDAENFAQHAEHYQRMLAEAQAEMDKQREQQEEQNRQRQAERDRERNERLRAQEEAANGDEDSDSGLVETPEARADDQPQQQAQPKPKRSRRKPKPQSDGGEPAPDQGSAPEAAE